MGADRSAFAAFGVLVVAAAARLAVLEDEAYYWTWSQHLALHYFDHPPLIAWLIRGAQVVGADRFWSLRLVSLACMAVTVALVPATAARLGGDHPEVRWRARWTLLGSPLVSVALLPATPDAALAASLAVAGYALVRAYEDTRGADVWAVVAGVAFGAGVLAKLPAGLAASGAVLGSAASREGRRRWMTAGPWVGAGLAAAVVGLWWVEAPGVPPSVAYQAGRVAGEGARWWVALPLTGGAAMLVAGPALTVALVAAWGRPPASPAARALLGGAAAVGVACVLAVGMGSGELNWLLPVVVMGAPVAVAAVEDSRWRCAYDRVVRAQALLVTLVLVHVVRPVWPIPAARDRTLRSAGWPAVAAVVEEQATTSGARVVFATRYQHASLLRYHLRDRWPVHERGGWRRSQYDLWPRPRACPGDVGVLVAQTSKVATVFRRLGPTAKVVRRRNGRDVGSIYVTPVRVSAALDADSCDRPPR